MSILRKYVTIVSGLPRSGTSMMMRMIEAGGIEVLTDHEREADVDNPNGYYEFEPVKKTAEDASWLEKAQGKVVKMVHLLLMDLPLDREYRVVFMRRNIEEIIRSQNKMLERKGQRTDDLPIDKLKSIFRSQIEEVLEYAKSNSKHFQIMEVNYNEVLTNAAEILPNITSFLEIQDLDALHAVVDPDLYRNRS